MNNFNLKGQIEVILEDENGVVKYREIQDNTITLPALKYMLYLMMSNGSLNTITRATQGTTMPSPAAPSTFGIYVMSSPVDIKKDTFRPPYVDNTGIGLHPNVSFYNLGGGTTETSNQMIMNDVKCHFDKGTKTRFALEYVKNSYSGVVRSVVIGRDHSSRNLNYRIQTKDIDLPAEWYTSTSNYLLEHTTDGTIVYNTISETSQYSANLKTKIFTTYAVATMHSTITSNFGGLIMNDTIFKVLKADASGSTYTTTLRYVRDWKNSTTVRTLSIPFTARNGMSVDTTVLPVLVAKPGQNKLEVFVTMSTGNHDGVMGANIQKAVIDISNLDDITYSIVDMGVIPYTISGYGTTVGQYMTGFFYDGKYYLPFYHRVNAGNGTLSGTAEASFQEGVVLSSDFSTEYRTTCYRVVSNQFYAFVQAEEVLQCLVNTTTTNYYQMLSQVLSGTNLETPITKGANDILRVIYRYELT